MLFNMEFKRSASTRNVINRPLPPLPPGASPSRPASERSRTESLLTRSNSVNSEDTLWTTSSGTSSPTRLKKRLWERSNSFTFGRKINHHSRRSSLADDATVISFGDVDSLCDSSSVEKSGSDEASSVLSELDPRNFEDLNRTTERCGIPHHPFDEQHVPYIQSYSPVTLDSDYHTFELLRRLVPNSSSPTFHDYGRRPPMKILDLGCGEGHWVLHAARAWRSAGTHVTGMDLIDLHNNDHGRVSRDREAGVLPRNVTFVRGNFVKYRLPFPDNSFDLVRMANLGLVIPCWTGDSVLLEVLRVLCPGGRLELIEDELLFPRIPTLDEIRGYKVPSPISASFSLNDIFTTYHHVSDNQLPNIPSPHNQSCSPGKYPRRSQSDIEYTTRKDVAEGLEKVFGEMIYKRNYARNMHPVWVSALYNVFGTDPKQAMLHEFSLGVPSREFVDSGAEREGAKRHVRRSRYSDGDVSTPLASSMTRSFDSTPKALRMLVGDGEMLRSPRAPQPYQPPGLVLLPSLNRLLPFSPAELEMHACKNMHVLLSCRRALTKHLMDHTHEDGKPLLSEDEINELLSDYDQFRRKRFNWPMDYPGLRMDEDPLESSPRAPLLRLGPSSSSFRGRDLSSSNPPSPRKLQVPIQRAIEVRAIRVYTATKTFADLSMISAV